jgi:hypothetical protein
MGVVFGLFAGFYYWIEYLLGFKYSTQLGKIHFILTFIGVNITFFPMHFLGLAGMPRRIPDYPDIYWTWNYYSSIGSLITVVGLFFFFLLLYNMISLRTLGITYLNEKYALINYNKLINLNLFINKQEYRLNLVFFKIINKYFFILKKLNLILYLIILIYELINFMFFRLIKIYILKNNIYIYIKYYFKYFYKNIYKINNIDRFYYSYFLKHCLNIWYINYNFISLLNNISFNYMSMFLIFTYFKKINVIKIIKLKIKFIIINLYLTKFINNLFYYIYIYIYNMELVKNYK